MKIISRRQLKYVGEPETSGFLIDLTIFMLVNEYMIPYPVLRAFGFSLIYPIHNGDASYVVKSILPAISGGGLVC